MRLIMVRHGDPDYEHDCLTEAGHRQAALVAGRLEREGISRIFSSPMGRARQTASYTADKLGLPIRILPFMHEITWGGPDLPENGHPWTLSDRIMTEEDADMSVDGWRRHPYYVHNAATKCYDEVTRQFDGVMAELGYHRTGRRYHCEGDTDRTVALFSHGGSGACVLAHLLSLPFPYVTAAMTYDFTSVIILAFPDRPGEEVYPRLELFNDTAHLRQASSRPQIQMKPD